MPLSRKMEPMDTFSTGTYGTIRVATARDDNYRCVTGDGLHVAAEARYNRASRRALTTARDIQLHQALIILWH